MTECIKIKCNGYAILIILFLRLSKIGRRLNYELFLKILVGGVGRGWGSMMMMLTWIMMMMMIIDNGNDDDDDH